MPVAASACPARKAAVLFREASRVAAPTDSIAHEQHSGMRGVGVAQGDALAPKWVETFRVQYSAEPAVAYTAVTS